MSAKCSSTVIDWRIASSFLFPPGICANDRKKIDQVLARLSLFYHFECVPGNTNTTKAGDVFFHAGKDCLL
jgi:hypothetical protein